MTQNWALYSLFWVMFGSLILQKVRSRGDEQPTANLA